MVAPITAGAGCGIAYLCGNSMTAMPTYDCVFSVTRFDCATGKFINRYIDYVVWCFVIYRDLIILPTKHPPCNLYRILLILPRAWT